MSWIGKNLCMRVLRIMYIVSHVSLKTNCINLVCAFGIFSARWTNTSVSQ